MKTINKYFLFSLMGFVLFFLLNGCGEIIKNEKTEASTNRTKRIEQRYAEMEKEFSSVILTEQEQLFILDYSKKMKSVPGGRVALGRNPGDPDGGGRQAVRLEVAPFKISSVEVTFNLYDIFCRTTGRPLADDNGWGRGRRPAINVSWYDAVEFANWMSLASDLKPCYFITKEREDERNLNSSDDKKWRIHWLKTAEGYRLPSEIEWEFAAKGASAVGETPFSGGENLWDVAVVFKNSGKQTSLTGQKRPNELGLYDMSGNVFEWCWDWFGDYPINSELKKYSGDRSGSTRILRGGSWYNSEKQCRTTHRAMGNPTFRVNRVGFRLAQNDE